MTGSAGGNQSVWGRLGWPITTVALGLALIASAVSNSGSARTASESVTRAHGDFLRVAIFRSVRDSVWRLPASLDSIVELQRDAGLRYAAFVEPDGHVRTAGGASRMPLPVISDTMVGARFVRSENLVQATFSPPPHRPPPRDDQLSPLRLVIEFEPTLALEMVSQALRSLVIAVVVAGVLMGVGLASWRVAERRERATRELAEQRRLTQLGEMSAVLAHEIRNPLASLKGHAQLLTEKLPADSPEGRRAHRVVDEAGRLEALTTDLLDFARTGPIDRQAVDPATLLRSAAAEVGGVPIAVEIDGAPARWLLDERRFGHGVLVNLLRNAVQVSPAGRPPLARATMEGDRLVFTVRDYGPGLPEGGETRIFDPFFTTNTQGTGLGLAVAQRIVELHGGRLTAANAPDGGALFRVELAPQET